MISMKFSNSVREFSVELGKKRKKVNASRTRYRLLGMELIPVYRQSR